jgi:hypothetical protein
VWVDRNGVRRPLSFQTNRCRHPSLSPSGQQLALACRGEGSGFDIGLGNLELGTFALWPSEGEDFAPIWTPDEVAITYSSHRDEGWSIRTKPADGSGPEEQLLESEYPLYPSSWSPDGKVLAFQWILPDTGEDIWLLPLEGERRPLPWRNSTSHESGARFSPDGRRIVYHSRESGAWHVYVGEYDGSGARKQLSTRNGGWPAWSRDGEIFYLTGSGERLLMSLDTEQGPGSIPSKPRPLFEEGGFFVPLDRRGPVFDLAPDGESIVFIGAEQDPQPVTKLHIVVNWFEELKQLVPTGR